MMTRPGSVVNVEFSPRRGQCDALGHPNAALGATQQSWGAITKRTPVPLSPEWREHVLKFAIEALARDETFLRFILPKAITGQFDLTDPICKGWTSSPDANCRTLAWQWTGRARAMKCAVCSPFWHRPR